MCVCGTVRPPGGNGQQCTSRCMKPGVLYSIELAEFITFHLNMPSGRPSKLSIPEDASCLSLCLPIRIHCNTCKRGRDSIGCKQPWGSNWINSSKEEDYFAAWDHLQANNYILSIHCSNARRKIKKKKGNKKVETNHGVKRRRTRSVSCIVSKN